MVSGADPVELDPVLRLIEAGQERERTNEARKVTCSNERTGQIESARAFVRTNWAAIQIKFKDACAQDKGCKDINGEQFVLSFGESTVYCPTEEKNKATGVVIEMPGQDYTHGAYGLFPSAFASPCELVDSVTHEEAHLITGSYHSFSSLGVDTMYRLGQASGEVCKEQGFSF